MSSVTVPAAARATLLVATKDLRAEARTRSVLQGVAFYAGLAVLLFSFALGPDSETLRRFAAGLLWLAIALASLLAVSRTFAAEREGGTLETLTLYPVAREALFMGKVAATFALLLAVGLVSLALMFVLYSVAAPKDAAALLGGIVLGTFGLAVIGTFYGAVVAHLRAREALMPTLLLPVLVPLVVSATQATDMALAGGPALRWLALLAAYDVVALVLSLVVFPYLLEQ